MLCIIAFSKRAQQRRQKVRPELLVQISISKFNENSSLLHTQLLINRKGSIANYTSKKSMFDKEFKISPHFETSQLSSMFEATKVSKKLQKMSTIGKCSHRKN